MNKAITAASVACSETAVLPDSPCRTLLESEFFRVTNYRGTVQINAMGVAGNRGEVTITPRTIEQIFDAVGSPAISEVRALIRDPWGIGPERACLYRNDLIGWPEDDDGYHHPIHSQEPCQLYLEATFPARGRIYFGEAHQEATQIAAFVSLKAYLINLFAARNSREARAAAQDRARTISATAQYSFLPVSGFCWACDQDVTPYIVEATSVVSCPLCWHSWND